MLGLLEHKAGLRNTGGIIGDTIVPFVKTPTNVLKMGLEYSPVGWMEALWKTYGGKNSLRKLAARGESTMALQRQIAELAGRGATGTAIIVMGMALKAIGSATGDEEENIKEREWQRTQGILPNSIKVGDTYYDLSSLPPLSIPLLAGAAKSGDITWGDFAKALSSMGNAALDMPVLQGLQELMGGGYGDKSFPTMAAEVIGNAAQQVIPGGSLLRQTANLSDQYVRTTAENDLQGIEKTAAQALNRIQSGIPGLRQNLPIKYDSLGNPIRNYPADNAGARAANIFINPLNTSKEKTSPVIDEINRLYAETQDRSVLPRLAANDVSYDGTPYRFSAAEKQEFQRAEGQKLTEMLQTLISSREYKTASTEEQVKMIKSLQDFAADTAKAEYLEGQGVDYASTDKWKNTVRELEQANIDNSTAAMFHAALNGFTTDAEKRDYLDSISWLSPVKRAALKAAFISDNNVDYSSDESIFLSAVTEAGQQRWPKAQAAGMSAEMYSRLYPIAVTSKLSKDEKIAQLMAATGWSYQQADYFRKLANSD